MIRDSQNGGATPPIHLVSTGFIKQGCGLLLRTLISAREVFQPGFLWMEHGGGQPPQLDHKRDRGSRTGSAELGFGSSASRRGQSDTQQLCQNHTIRGLLNLRKISTTPPE